MLNNEQPNPQPNASQPIWDLVIADMKERNRIGTEKYGTPLQAGNGRDPLVDAYQEALDLCVYLRQAIQERAIENTKLPIRSLPACWCCYGYGLPHGCKVCGKVI